MGRRSRPARRCVIRLQFVTQKRLERVVARPACSRWRAAGRDRRTRRARRRSPRAPARPRADPIIASRPSASRRVDRRRGRPACTPRTADDSRVRCAARRRRRRRPARADVARSRAVTNGMSQATRTSCVVARRVERRVETAERAAPGQSIRIDRAAGLGDGPGSRPPTSRMSSVIARAPRAAGRESYGRRRTSALLSRPPKRRARPPARIAALGHRLVDLTSGLNACAKPASAACSSPACIRALRTSCRRVWASTRTG